MNILIVDDEITVGELVFRIIVGARAGHCATVVTSARQVLDLVGAGVNQYQLVISDIQMPHMNGIELAKRLAELDHPPLVVLMSGNTEALQEARDLRIPNVIALVAKPFSQKTIHGFLEKAKKAAKL